MRLADRQFELAAYRVLADDIVFIGSLDQAHQVACARPVLGRQPGGVGKVRVIHPQQSGLRIHCFDEPRYATGISAAKQLGRAILRRHQRQMQRGAARHFESRPQIGANPRSHHLVLRDLQFFAKRQIGVQRHQRRHQLGDRSDWKDRILVLLEQDLIRILIDDQRNRGPQIEWIVAAMQARQMAFGRCQDARDQRLLFTG